jgi:hypothetical protein
MNRDIAPRDRMILDTLWDIVNGQYPSIEGLTDHECKTLFMGGEIPGINNPFLPLTADMEVKMLPPMILKTTSDMQMRDKQMAVHHMYNNINRMLGLLARVVEQLEVEDIASNVF